MTPSAEREAVAELAGGAVLGHLGVPVTAGVDQRDAARHGADQPAAVPQQLAQDRRERRVGVELAARRQADGHRADAGERGGDRARLAFAHLQPPWAHPRFGYLAFATTPQGGGYWCGDQPRPADEPSASRCGRRLRPSAVRGHQRRRRRCCEKGSSRSTTPGWRSAGCAAPCGCSRRSSCRRLRRELNTDLAWYAALLGAVRDREVLRLRLGEAVAALPSGLVLGPVAEHIDQHLLSEQTFHHEELTRAMDERPVPVAAGRADRLGRAVRRTRSSWTTLTQLIAAGEEGGAQGQATAGRGARRTRHGNGAAPGAQGRETRALQRGAGRAARRRQGGFPDPALQARPECSRHLPGQRPRGRPAAPSGCGRGHSPGPQRVHVRPALRPGDPGRRARPRGGRRPLNHPRHASV